MAIQTLNIETREWGTTSPLRRAKAYQSQALEVCSKSTGVFQGVAKASEMERSSTRQPSLSVCSTKAQEKARCYFIKPVQKGNLAARLHRGAMGLCDKLAKAIISTKQRLSRISDHEMEAQLRRNLFSALRSPAKARNPYIAISHLQALLARRFEALFRESATTYFQKRVDAGVMTLDNIKKQLDVPNKSEDISLEKLVATIPFSKLIPLIPEDIRKALISGKMPQDQKDLVFKSSPKSPWQGLWTAIDHALTIKGNQLQNSCCKRFLRLFTEEELTHPDAWTLCFAQDLAEVQESDIPACMHGKLREMMQSIPANYKEQVALLNKKQREIVEVLTEDCQIFQRLFQGAVNVQEVLHQYLGVPTIEEGQRSAMNSVIINYAEQMPCYPKDAEVVYVFLQKMRQVLLMRDLWKEATPEQRSEEAFKAAYETWSTGRNRMIVDELETAVRKSIFLKKP